MDNFEKKFPYNLGLIAETFNLNVVSECQHLNEWITATFQLNDIEKSNFDYLYEQVKIDGKYWNEEEYFRAVIFLKASFISQL